MANLQTRLKSNKNLSLWLYFQDLQEGIENPYFSFLVSLKSICSYHLKKICLYVLRCAWMWKWLSDNCQCHMFTYLILFLECVTHIAAPCYKRPVELSPEQILSSSCLSSGETIFKDSTFVHGTNFQNLNHVTFKATWFLGTDYAIGGIFNPKIYIAVFLLL